VEKYGKERLVLMRIVRKLGVRVFSMECLLGKQVEHVKIYSAIIQCDIGDVFFVKLIIVIF